MDPRPAAAWIFAFAVVLLAPLAARASSFELDPVTVTLTPDATSHVVEVRNRSTRPLRMQIKAFAWSQSDAGEMQLAPTGDVVFFPSILVIAPGQTRKLRLGVVEPAAKLEKSYRLSVEELPPLELASVPAPGERAGAAAGPDLRTRMIIPVFFRPAAAAPHPRVGEPTVSGGVIHVSAENAGAAHMVLSSVRVTVRDASGDVVRDERLRGWYVLAQGVRRYEVAAPATCKSALRVDVRLETDAGEVTSTSALPCAMP
jgi:fimbrial chaperone protein